jgi:type IV secretory pathway VirD2 relaxase
VRITYARNTVKGQWAAHGRYVARESAQRNAATAGVGFDGQGESVNIAARLASWQRTGDEQVWKLIISPEFGDRIDLQKLTRELMQRIDSSRHSAPLEWVATTHYNTEHPHVHVALRGVDQENQAVRFRRDFIKQGIREIAGNLCTQQLGYRSEFDAAAAQRSEVGQLRFTSLDKIISRSARATAGGGDSRYFKVVVNNPKPRGIMDGARLRNQHIFERLIALQRMGLAEAAEPNEWRVRQDFESVLRGMQRVADRQRTLAKHGALISDERLSIEAMDGRNWKVLEGRVLVHGEEEGGYEAGRSYLMLEGTDARVHHIYYTPEIEAARNRGQFRTNSFVRLRRYLVDGEPLVETEDLGDAAAILRNKRYLSGTARQLVKRGIIPGEEGWGGWLGRYQAALKQAAEEVRQIQTRETERSPKPKDARGR